MKRFAMTWDEVAEKVMKKYGIFERAMWVHDMEDAAAMEAYKKANTDGVQRSVIGVSNTSYLASLATTHFLKRKSKPGEEVTFSRLGPDLSIRVW